MSAVSGLRDKSKIDLGPDYGYMDISYRSLKAQLKRLERINTRKFRQKLVLNIVNDFFEQMTNSFRTKRDSEGKQWRKLSKSWTQAKAQWGVIGRANWNGPALKGIGEFTGTLYRGLASSRAGKTTSGRGPFGLAGRSGLNSTGFSLTVNKIEEKARARMSTYFLDFDDYRNFIPYPKTLNKNAMRVLKTTLRQEFPKEYKSFKFGGRR
jgi:hypothetical protein